MTFFKLVILTSTITIFLISIVGCGGTNQQTINIDGSSTVYPITEAATELYTAEKGRFTRIPIAISGTGGGFKKFVTGETDISNASRSIRGSERELAIQNGIEYLEIRIGTDGLAVVVNKDNNFAQCLTTEELKKIWEPGSTIANWNSVNENFPNQKLVLFGPDNDSGTYDFFTDEINGEEGSSRQDYQASANDNILVTGVSGEIGAIGYFGYAYYINNSDKVQSVSIDSGAGCTSPTQETVLNGEYEPLSRPLFIYVNKQSLQEKPYLVDYVKFYLENAQQIVTDVGYVALSQLEYSAELAKITN